MKNYLIHHGIKGQSWGVQNGPPYPLNAEDHNAAERKANWRSSLSKASDSISKAANSVKNAANSVKKTSDKIRNFKLSDKQKRAIKIGVAVAGAAVAAYGAYKIGSMAKPYIQSGANAIKSMKLTPQEKLDIKKEKIRMDHLLKAANDANNTYNKTAIAQLMGASKEDIKNLRTAEALKVDYKNAKAAFDKVWAGVDKGTHTMADLDKASKELSSWRREIIDSLDAISDRKISDLFEF